MRNALFTLFLGGVLAYGATFAWYMLDRFDLVNLIRDVTYDDAYYYFQTAYHMAQGEFSTFDGGITRTNGYHPLWLFLITPFYWVFDKVEALYAIKAFEIMLIAGGVALVAGAARAAGLPWILLFGVLPTVYQRSALFSGMEAAAGLFMLGGLLLTVCLYARDPARWRWALAVVAFALPWVRLEYVAISLAATGALCLLEWSWRDPAARGALALLRVRAGAPFLAAGGGLLVYFAYNAVVFGGVLPVSGAVKRFWSERLFESEGGYSLAGNLDAFLSSRRFDDEVLLALVLCVFPFLVWRCARRTRAREDWLLLAFLVGVFSLAAGHLAKFVQNVLTVHPEVGGSWYYAPAYLMKPLAVPTLCYVALYLVRRFLGPGPRSGSGRAYRDPRVWIFLAGAFFLFVKADFSRPYRFVDSKSEAVGRNWAAPAYMGTMVMNRLLPAGSVVGSWNSGFIGYFSRFPVVNLDGLINSYGYLRAVKEGADATFVARFGLSHIADISPLADSGHRLLFESVPLDVDWWKGDGDLRFRLWPAAGGGADRSERFWERMDPHLARQADGAGLLLDGRMGLAFARDCAPGQQAEWTWGAGTEPARVPWTKTGIGVCVSPIVLPHGALPPVRVGRGEGEPSHTDP